MYWVLSCFQHGTNLEKINQSPNPESNPNRNWKWKEKQRPKKWELNLFLDQKLLIYTHLFYSKRHMYGHIFFHYLYSRAHNFYGIFFSCFWNHEAYLWPNAMELYEKNAKMERFLVFAYCYYSVQTAFNQKPS